MFHTLIKKLFSTRNDRVLRKIQPLINRINALEISLKNINNAELAKKNERI